MSEKQDPTQPMLLMARAFAGVVEGSACSQTSFKVGKKAFFYVGMQGGRFKTMFKLKASLPEATKLAEMDPADYEVGKFGWVTARFSTEKPMPVPLWKKWLEESYCLAGGK